MRIMLFDLNPEIVRAWKDAFNGTDVDTFLGDFRDISKHVPGKYVLCSAGNSYGVMGGGLDLAIAKRFPGIEDYVRTIIRNVHFGELHVGQVILVPIHDKDFELLLYAPTMRAPIHLYNVENVYLATSACLKAYQHLTKDVKDTVLLMPGFGGLCGGLKPKSIAAAMRLAYDNHVRGYMPTTSEEMWAEHKKIGSCNA